MARLSVINDKSNFQILLLLTLVTLAGCSTVQEKEPQPLVIKPPTPAVKYALSLQGTPYNYGSDNPKQGFDCSGFVKHVYEQQGIKLPRSAYDMALSLPTVEKQKIQSGDLVFFDVNGKPYSHVGIYIKDDQFIHAPSERTGRVLISTLRNNYWQRHYHGARRPNK